MPTFSESRFKGLDAYHEAPEVPPGFLTVCDNLTVEAAGPDGGTLALRKGLRPLFTSALGAPIYGMTAVQRADGTATLVFTSGGKLYKCGLGSTAPTEILDGGGASVSLNSATTWFCLAGGKLYFCDGQAASPLRYTDLTNWFEAPNLSKPSGTQGVGAGQREFSATLEQSVLIAQPGADLADWSQQEFTSGVVWTPGAPQSEITQPHEWNFQGGAILGTAPTLWNIGSDADNNNLLDANADPCVELDSSTGSLTNEYAESDAFDVPNDGASAYARVAYVDFDMAAEDSGTNEPTEYVDVRLQLYSDSGATTLITGTDTARREGPAGERPALSVRTVFDYRSLSTTPLKWKARFDQPVNRGGSRGTDVNHVQVYFPAMRFDLASTGAGELIVRQGSVARSEGKLLTDGLTLELDLGGTGTDWSRKSRLTLKWRAGDAIGNLAARLYLREHGSSTKHYTNPLEFDAEKGEAYVDVSTLDPADLETTRYVGIEFLGDCDAEGATDASNLTVLTLGAITETGNLPVGYDDVYYLLVEVNDNGDADVVNVIQSDGSQPTAPVTPTENRAIGRVFLPGRTNSAATHRKLFRFGGTNRDGRGRLVAFWEFGEASFDYGAAPDVGTGYTGNPYIKWVAPAGDAGGAGGELWDNTPDSYLFNAEQYEPGRNAPPLGARAGCEHAGRLWLAVDATLKGSWLLPADQNAGLYYTDDPLDAVRDPSAPVKGFTVPVGSHGAVGSGGTSDARDPIAGLYSFKETLTVTKTVSRPHLLFGSDPRDFALLPYKGTDAAAQYAQNGGTIWQGATVYVGPDGLVAFNGADTEGFGEELLRLLNGNLVIGGSALLPAAYAQCFLFVHGEDLYLGAPGGADDTAPAVLYRFDDKMPVPTRFTGMAMSCGVATRGTGDTSSLILGGQNGNVYVLDGEGDKATTAGAASAISWAVETRRFGADSPDLDKTALWWTCQLDSGAEATTVTAKAVGEDAATRTWTKSYTLSASGGTRRLKLRVRKDVKGATLLAGISGSSKKRFVLRQLGLECAAGERRAH